MIQHDFSPANQRPVIESATIMPGGSLSLGSLLVTHLLLLYNVHQVQCKPGIAAAAGGAAFALGGGNGEVQFASGPSSAMIGLLIASAAGGVIVVMLLYILWRLFRRYVLKIKEPPGKNFQLDKKVKCNGGKYSAANIDFLLTSKMLFMII